jgi:Flp pilus assembly protein TadD
MACLLWLNGCESASKGGDIAAEAASSGASDPVVAGSVRRTLGPALEMTPAGQLGEDRNDDLGLGKRHFRAARFELAERHFRRAVESDPRDLESWVGLAACYDQLRRFDLADRAYEEAQRIGGRRAEILNNRGYSYILRGDYPRASEILLQAQARDPASPYIKNNLELLAASRREGKTIR